MYDSSDAVIVEDCFLRAVAIIERMPEEHLLGLQERLKYARPEEGEEDLFASLKDFVNSRIKEEREEKQNVQNNP